MFRNNAQNNVNLLDDKDHSGVAEQVQQFLEEIETENITILKTEQVLIISPKKEMNNIHEFPFDDNLENIKDEMESEDLNDIEEYENQQISTLKRGLKSRKKISDLLPNELALRSWCSRQVKSQKSIIQTPQGTKFQWSCSKCNHHSTNRKYFMQHLKRKHFTMTEDDYIKLNKNNEPENQLKTTYPPQQLEMKNWYAQQMKSQMFIIKTANGEIMQWSCSQCSYNTTTCAKTFAKHLKTKHFNEKASTFKTYSCTKCCINYQTISQSSAHQKFHEFIDVIAYHISYPECEQCRIIFCNVNDLDAHLIVHNSPRFFHKPFASIGFMVTQVQHVETKCNELLDTNEECFWKCGHCIKIFFDKLECIKHQLLFHVVIFVCPYDNQEFRDGNIISNFRVHVSSIL